MDRLENKPGNLLGITVGVFIALFFLANVAVVGVLMASGGDLSGLASGDLSGIDANQLRWVLLASNLAMFALTAVVSLYIVYKNRWVEAAGLNRGASLLGWAGSAATFIAALPLVGYAAYVNLQVPLPEWAVTSEAQANALLGKVMDMDGVGALLLSLLTVAVTPGLGEELLLRGVVQRRIFRPWMNAHLAIFAAAFLFSFLHFEFAGFLPRLILGVLLGYAYFWSNSLWVPIVIHLCFNGFQVILAYVTGEFTPDTDMTDAPQWWAGLIGLVLALFIGRYVHQKLITDDPSRHSSPLPE